MATGAPKQRDVRGIVIGIHEIAKLKKQFEGVAAAMQTTELIDQIGQQQEDAARRRITRTKRAPDGKPWAPWSQGYAKTRERRHSLLVGEGDLRDTLTHEVVSPSEVLVGSPLRYARAHLRGNPARKLPARPYLDTVPGFADPQDRSELRDILRAFWKKQVGK